MESGHWELQTTDITTSLSSAAGRITRDADIHLVTTRELADYTRCRRLAIEADNKLLPLSIAGS